MPTVRPGKIAKGRTTCLAKKHVAPFPGRYCYDKASLLLAEETTTLAGKAMRHASDYRAVAGLQFAHRQEVEIPDVIRQPIILKTLELNQPLEPARLAELAGEGP